MPSIKRLAIPATVSGLGHEFGRSLLMIQSDTRAAPKIMGIGTLIIDHVFVADSNSCSYHGSRGGGTVWNILVRLALAGFATDASGAYAPDGPGNEALGELRWFGVGTNCLAAGAGKQSLVFTQVHRNEARHGPAIPQEQFVADCAVCERTVVAESLPRFSAAQIKQDMLKGCAALCADRLTGETLLAARMAQKTGTLSVLDLGGTSGLVGQSTSLLVSWAGEFDVLVLPLEVALWLGNGSVTELVRAALSVRTVLVAITMGQKGFSLYQIAEDGSLACFSSPAPDVDSVIDATGAGDAFTASLIGFMLPAHAGGRPGNFQFRDERREAMIAAVRAAPIRALGGVGARSDLPAGPICTQWGARLSGLRGQGLNRLRASFAQTRPCLFCARE